MSDGSGSLWRASSPSLPPFPGLAAPTYMSFTEEKVIKRVLWLFPLAVLISATVLVVSRGPALGYGLGLIAAPVIVPLVFLSARRSCEAIGPGWVYSRRGLVGNGKSIRLSGLSNVDAVGRGHSTLVRLTGDDGVTIRFALVRLESIPLGPDLARQVLQSGAAITPRASEIFRSLALS